MFEISTSAAPKAAVSALTALAAIGASGMVAEGAVVELQPTQGAYGLNSSYIGTGYPENWGNWLDSSLGVTYQGAGPAFVNWSGLDLSRSVSSAKYRVNANGSSFSYGIPAGATLDFSLITEPWSAATPDPSNTGPDHGTTLGIDFVQRAALAGDQDVDITPLLQTWQANPSAYYGVRFFVSAGVEDTRGGVVAPYSSDYGDPANVTGTLIIDQTSTPEPTSLALLGVGSVLGLRRRKA